MDSTELIEDLDPARDAIAMARESEPAWADAVRGLGQRVLGPAAESIRYAALPASPPGTVSEGSGSEGSGSDEAGRRYAYTASRGVLDLAATDGVSAAVGLHQYLRERCGVSVGWDTRLPLMLDTLPDSPKRAGAARVRHGYYLNFCTFSYTTAYWDWANWEREIDWMALHGITLPLAATGHEAALSLAYSRLGLADDAIRRFLGGPGYLPFQFMGCLDGFGGPLPASWIERRRGLGRRILDRQRAFGMRPVLPAFTGHVPREVAPDRVTGREWQGFSTYVLDPKEPLYAEIAAEVVRAQRELFDSDHLYAADPFIEMLPIDADPAYPGMVAEATLAGLSAGDERAVWVLQAWPFSYQRDFWTAERVAAFLDAIPDERILVADLWAEQDPQWQRLDQFAGKPWLWCALLNFGGRTDPGADLRAVPAAVNAGLAAPNPPVGLGLSMEATRNNPAFFELVADQLWNPVTDVDAWLDAFVSQRYAVDGTTAGELRTAWRDLLATVYAAPDARLLPTRFGGVITARPSYAVLGDDAAKLRSDVESARWYEPARLVEAWRRLVEAAEHEPEMTEGPLGHDLVEVGIAVLSRLADRYCLNAVEHSLRLGGASAPHLKRFLQIFTDLDRMLAARTEFGFHHWEARALAWADGPDERAVLADNARRILTVWGSTTNRLLDDYAARHWAGLVGGYYLDRWQSWADGLDAALAAPGDIHERALQERLHERAERFLRDGAGPRPDDPGHLATESRRLFAAYAESARDLGDASETDRSRGRDR